MIQLNDLIFYSVIVVLMIGVGVMGWVLYYGNKLVKEKYTETNNKPHLVIAHYRENLDWMNDFDLSAFNVTIYTKYDQTTVKNGFRCIHLPNIGRDAHTFLYHIVQNYDNLPEIVCMTQSGLLNNKVKHERKFNQFKYMIENYNNTTFKGIISNGMAYNENIYNFTLDSYKGVTDENNDDSILTPSSIRPYGKWLEQYVNIKPTDVFCLSFIFAVSKERILRYPKSIYENLLHDLSHYGNSPEVAHYMERALWAMYS